MNWLGPLVLLVAAYLIWTTFWAVAPLLVGVILGIGLQERFPKLSTLIGDVIESLRASPPPPSTTLSVKRRKTSTRA
jgi:hypothetical protein